MSQKVLIMSTENPSLRSEVHGWTCEDSSLFVKGKHIGHTPHDREYHTFKTVLEALHHGWKLLAPPEKVEWDNETWYDWWLVKD